MLDNQGALNKSSEVWTQFGMSTKWAKNVPTLQGTDQQIPIRDDSLHIDSVMILRNELGSQESKFPSKLLLINKFNWWN